MIINSNNNDYISYEGKIKVSLVKNKKVYSEKIFYNNGRWPIFKNLTYSLAGNYTDADQWRPLILDIYSVPESFVTDQKCPVINSTSRDTKDPANGNWKDESIGTGEIRRYANKPNIVTSYHIQYYTAPVTSDDALNGIGSSSVTYKFKVPFESLSIEKDPDTGWSDYNIKPLNLVCLYSKSNFPGLDGYTQSQTYGNPSAFFFIKDSSGNLSSLLPKEITSNIGEYDLIIEWTLGFTSGK